LLPCTRKTFILTTIHPTDRRRLRLSCHGEARHKTPERHLGELIASESPTDWFSEKAQGLYEIRDHLKSKTTWHPIGA
jgi:hypothetical protein